MAWLFTGALKTSLNEVVLNATNASVCFTVTDNTVKKSDDPRSFTITLIPTRNQDYNITFNQQNITISIIDANCKIESKKLILSLSLSLSLFLSLSLPPLHSCFW